MTGQLSSAAPARVQSASINGICACLQCVAILNQDSFYRELTEGEKLNVHGTHHLLLC